MRASSHALICAILPVHTALAFLGPAPLPHITGGKYLGGQGLCLRHGFLNARQQPRSRAQLGLSQSRMQYGGVDTAVKKVLPLSSGGNLIIAERGWILETIDGVDESWGDQAIPIELDDQLAWLLYRDGEVIITITDDDIDAADPMEGGSNKITDPLSMARNTPAGGILNIFGSAMSMLRPKKDSGLFSRWASEPNPPSQDRRMARAIADVQQEVDTLSIEESLYDEDDVVEPAPVVSPAVAASAAAAPAKQEKNEAADEEAWVAARREGVLLVNEARSRMSAGLLSEAVESATAAMAIFSAEEKRGVAAATEQRVRAEGILADAATAKQGQAVARAEAVRLAGEAKEWLQTGDLDQALMLAEKAQEALQEVEKCYGRVTASELTTVLEIRVRAEEKAQMRREATAATQDGPEASKATRKREEAEKRQQSKLAAKKKEEARKLQAGEAPTAPAPAEKEVEVEAWREAKNLGASLNRGAKLALKAGQLDEALALAEEAAAAFKQAAALGYRKGDVEARSSRSLAERAQMARDATRAGASGGKVVKERKEKKEKSGGGDQSRENEELAALFAVEAYGADRSQEVLEREEAREKEEAERREEEEAKRREEEEKAAEEERARKAEEERVRAEAEAEAKAEAERRRKAEEAEKLKSEADALYRAIASKRQQDQDAEAMADAEKTLAKWKEAEEETAREEEEARMRAEAEARAKEAIAAKKREEEEARRREAEAKAREEAEQRRVEAEAKRTAEEEARRRGAAEAEKGRREGAGRAAAEAVPFATGEMVEAMFYEDFDWYQARVLTQEIGGKQWVLFVDYGDEQETKISDLRYPPGVAPPTPRPAPAPAAPAPAPPSAALPPPPVIALRAPPRASPELRESAGRQGSGTRQGSAVPLGEAVAGTQMLSVGAGGEPIGEKRYEMPVKYHGVLLGKQGLTVKAMQKASGAQIRFEKEPIGAIVIKGTAKQREEAWKLVKGMQATLPMLLTKLRSEEMDKQKVWPAAVNEAIARVREDSVNTNE